MARYALALAEAWEWVVDMQVASGAVYDIWVDDANMYKAPGGSNPHDFLQVGGNTDVKEYYSSASKTYLGEFSLMLAAALLGNVGVPAPGAGATADYLGSRMVFSNWYVLSYALGALEPLRVFPAPIAVHGTGGTDGLGGEPGQGTLPYPSFLTGVVLLCAGLAVLCLCYRRR
jgi:hypothetical protein